MKNTKENHYPSKYFQGIIMLRSITQTRKNTDTPTGIGSWFDRRGITSAKRYKPLYISCISNTGEYFIGFLIIPINDTIPIASQKDPTIFILPLEG